METNTNALMHNTYNESKQIDQTSLFDFISDSDERRMIENGYQAVSELELWEWLKMYEPDKYGFMFSSHENISHIGQKMQELPNYPNHSGSSFGHSMRILQYIAKAGLEKFRQDILF